MGVAKTSWQYTQLYAVLASHSSHCHPANGVLNTNVLLPYSRKYWRALNLAVEPKIAIERILADLNLAVRYGIAIRIYASRKFWRILIWRW